VPGHRAPPPTCKWECFGCQTEPTERFVPGCRWPPSRFGVVRSCALLLTGHPGRVPNPSWAAAAGFAAARVSTRVFVLCRVVILGFAPRGRPAFGCGFSLVRGPVFLFSLPPAVSVFFPYPGRFLIAEDRNASLTSTAAESRGHKEIS